MSRHALSAFALLALVSSAAAAQSGSATITSAAATASITPLVDKHYTYPNVVSLFQAV